MAERGRPSVKSLSLVTAINRPAPPDHLNEDEKSIWLTTVNSLPAIWFREETLELLDAYCCHIARRKIYAAQLRDLNIEDDTERYIKLSRMEMEESKIAALLATKMRLTQLSTFDRTKSKRIKSGADYAPWRDNEEED